VSPVAQCSKVTIRVKKKQKNGKSCLTSGKLLEKQGPASFVAKRQLTTVRMLVYGDDYLVNMK